MPPTHPDIASIAAALGHPSRAAMAVALLDGRAWTVGELSRHVGVAASTGTSHVHRLVEAGIVGEVRQGRHRYIRLAGPEVATALEALGVLTEESAAAPRALRAQRADTELRAARTCYGHLAGRLATDLVAQWVELGVITPAFALTEEGAGWFRGVGCDWPAPARRALARPCLDWTERTEHLAGVVADAFAQRGLDEGWFVRGRHPRSVLLTAAGRATLHEHGLTPPDEFPSPSPVGGARP